MERTHASYFDRRCRANSRTLVLLQGRITFYFVTIHLKVAATPHSRYGQVQCLMRKYCSQIDYVLVKHSSNSVTDRTLQAQKWLFHRL